MEEEENYEFPESDSEEDSEHNVWEYIPIRIMYTDSRNKICPINLSAFTSVTNYCICPICNHKFNSDALQKWVAKQNNCPICRSPWEKYIIYMPI